MCSSDLTYSAPDDDGCCAVPGHPDICTQTTEESCCGADTDCIFDYFTAGTCDVELCTFVPACCIDECADVSYKASCADRSQWRSGVCEEQPECHEACCVCANAEGEKIVHDQEEIGRASCRERV